MKWPKRPAGYFGKFQSQKQMPRNGLKNTAGALLDCLDQDAYDIFATVDDYLLKALTRHIAVKLSVPPAIHRDERPGSGHLFYQIRP